MTPSPAEQIAIAAARLVVEDALDYAQARRKASAQLGLRPRNGEGPSHEQIENEVRAYLDLFHAETQPVELRALRALALRWMRRLGEFRPHLGGAVWRGTATRLSPVLIDLYCDDSKAAEIALINHGIDYDAAPSDAERPVLLLDERCAELGEVVTLQLTLRDLDDLRGALKPDARGRSWRGDTAAVERLLAAA